MCWGYLVQLINFAVYLAAGWVRFGFEPKPEARYDLALLALLLGVLATAGIGRLTQRNPGGACGAALRGQRAADECARPAHRADSLSPRD
jgi:hypothetical protein